MAKSYSEILDELAQWEYHDLLEQHSLQELKNLKERFDKHRKELIRALEEKEKLGELE